MLNFREALAEDCFPAVCTEDCPGDVDTLGGWDVDVFPETELRPSLRLFADGPPDVRLHCRGGRVVSAHRAVLAEVSYFQSLFNGQFREREADSLEINEEADVFFEVVRWIYCCDASADKDIVLDVLRLAEFYGIDGLIDHCGRAIAAQELGREKPHGAGAEASPGADDGGGAEDPLLSEDQAWVPGQEGPRPEGLTVVDVDYSGPPDDGGVAGAVPPGKAKDL